MALASGEGGGAHATAPSVYRWPASVQIRGLIRKYANRFGEVGKGEDKQGEKKEEEEEEEGGVRRRFHPVEQKDVYSWK